MPAKSKQQQKFFGVVKAMQKGDIPKKGEAGEVADDMTKKEVDKMASTKHKGLPKKIKEMIDEELQALNEVKPFVDDKLRKKYTYPLGDRSGLVYLATNDKRYPTELVIYNIKRDVFHFVHSQMGNWSRATTETVDAKTLSSTHWVQDYFEDWKEDFEYEKGFKEAKLPDEGFSEPEQMREAKSANALRSNYDKAVKKEQSLSSLLLVNLEKFKAAKAKGDEKAIAKHTKIAGDLSKKKKDATENASKAYKAYQDKITGLHSDAELELKEGKLNEGRGVMDLIKDAVDELMFDSNISEKEAAMELVTAISDEYQFDAKLKEGMLNEMDMNDPVLMAFRASKQNMPKSKSASRKISFDKYLSLLDMQTDLQNDIKELADLMAQTLRDMEQEAEPGGGPAADRYASLMMKQEKEYKILKAKKAKVDVQIDKYQSL